MRKIEEMLNNKKVEIDEIEIPEELEGRLRGALDRVKPKKKSKYKPILKIASLITAITLLGYNIDTLAFYGKKIMGFDTVMTDTLKKLNELGKGQIIDKSYTFKNGVKVTIDGVMLDDNQLMMFYTVSDPRGNIEDLDIEPMRELRGKTGKHYVMVSGVGTRNEEGTEIKWRAEFEKPYFFEKNFTLICSLKNEDKIETGEISFTLDRSKAMGHTLKKNLNKSIKIDQGEMKFESIVASPTTTYIEGKIQNIFELAKDELSGEGFRPTGLDIRLIANGKEVQCFGGGIGTNFKGITFYSKFDALPEDLKTLQIKLVSFLSDNKVDEKVQLSKSDSGKKSEILGQQIEINKVYEAQGKTYVTITSEEDVSLSKVNLIIDGESIELKDTTRDNMDKKIDGTILYTRTLCFEGTGKELTLKIKGIRYNKVYNEIIDVPIE